MAARKHSDIRGGLVASTWEGAFAQAFITLTSGIFLVKFTGRIGGGDVVLGLMAAVPFLAWAVQLFTGWLYERVGNGRRGVTEWTLVVSRVIWLLPAALALGWLPEGLDMVVFFGVLAASALLATAGAHGWWWWMSDLVPAPVRGRYFGVRNAVMAAVAILVGYSGGLALDALEGKRDGLGFATVYGAAAVAGVFAWLAIRRQHHPSVMSHGPRVPFRVLWKETWSKPEHMRVFAFFTPWNAALGIAVPFWAQYMSVDLGMSSAAIAAQGTVGALVSVLLLPAWGRVIDRVGTRPVLLVNAAGICLLPFLWLLARPGFRAPVWIDAVWVGVVWTGFNLTALNVPLAIAPKRGGALFLGVFTALNGLAMGASCIAGGFIAAAMGPGPHDVLGMRLATYQVMFLATGVLRLMVLPLAFRLPDPRAKSLVFLVAMVSTAVRQRLNTGWVLVSAPWRRRGG